MSSNPLTKLMLKRGAYSATGFSLLFLALVLINVLAGWVSARWDLTEENLYTLSEGSQRILEKLDEPVTLKYYFSQSIESTPALVKVHARKVRELLKEYESNSNGKLTLQVFDPKPDTDEEEWAVRYGLSSAQMGSGGRLFHGLVVLVGEREAALPFFDPRREKYLEYEISEALTRISQEKKSSLGLISFLPVMGRPDQSGRVKGQWAVVSQLEKSFNVDYLSPFETLEIPLKIKLVTLIHPKAIPDTLSYALDQFLLRGGRLMVFVDPFSRNDKGSPGLPPGGSSSMDKLFAHWGVKFASGKVVADHTLATTVNIPGIGQVSYPVWLSLKKSNMNTKSVITGELENLIMIESGAFKHDDKAPGGKSLKFSPLISTPPEAGMVDGQALRFSNPKDVGANLKPGKEPLALAGLLSGTFLTAYPSGPPKATALKEGEKPPKRSQAHRILASGEATVLLVGDADFIADDYSVRRVQFFGQEMLSPLNDNLNFFMNAVEFLAGNPDLINVRSRGKFSRPFTKVDEFQKQAQIQFMAQEQALSKTLGDVQKKLASLEQQKKQTGKVLLNAQAVEEIKRFRFEEAKVKRELRNVRKMLRQDIESLGNTLLIFNLVLMPLLVAGVGFFIIYRRTKSGGGRA